jgi:hypothetical protein
VAIGRSTRTELDSTIVFGEFVRAFDNADQVRLTGMLGAYARQAYDGPIGAHDGARLQFEAPPGADQLTRQVWTDVDAFHWQPGTLSPGLHLAGYEAVRRLPQPIVARATFDANGLTGQIHAGPYEGLSDALLATPAGNLAALLHADGKFTASTADRLHPGQYTVATVLSDDERNRADVYQRLLDRNSSRLARQPCLFAWARPLKAPLNLLPEVNEKGAALLAIPLVLHRPAAETPLRIPSVFLTFESVPHGAEPASTAYDNAKRQWIGPLTVGSRIALRFQLPKEILPVRLVDGELRLVVRAPGRTVDVAGIGADQEIPLASFSSPAGRVPCRIANAQNLQIDSSGGVRLLVTVGSRPDERLASISTVGWMIEDVQLDLAGVAVSSERPAVETKASP